MLVVPLLLALVVRFQVQVVLPPALPVVGLFDSCLPSPTSRRSSVPRRVRDGTRGSREWSRRANRKVSLAYSDSTESYGKSKCYYYRRSWRTPPLSRWSPVTPVGYDCWEEWLRFGLIRVRESVMGSVFGGGSGTGNRGLEWNF